MPQSMLTIKQRLNTVGSIRKITNAMKLIASSRFARFKNLLEDAEEYGKGMDKCLTACFESVDFSKGTRPSCMQVNDGGDRDLYIVVTSTLGLCGGYNNEVYKLADSKLDKSSDAFFIGEKGYRHFKDQVGRAYDDFLHLGDSIAYSEVNRLRHHLDNIYLRDRYRAIYIIYTHPINSMTTQPTIEKLFPMEVKEPTNGAAGIQISFDPDPRSVADTIVPHWLDSKLYRCLLESAVSEQTCRRNSMDSATQSADELTRELKLDYNKMRQQKITQEITEVVSGSRS